MLWLTIIVALLWVGIALDIVGRHSMLGVIIATLAAVSWLASAPESHADNKLLNDGVVANVYTVAHQAGCTDDIKINPQLRQAAQWHTIAQQR